MLRSHKIKRLLLTTAILLLTTGGSVGAYSFIHVRNVRSEQKKNNGVANVKNEPVTSAQSGAGHATDGQTGTGNSKEVAGDTSVDADTSAAPAQPYGNFVNNHQPGADGSPTAMRSVCNTTPGATCDIRFTSVSGLTKDLGAKTTDSSGAVIWAWDIQGSNMAPGEWTITATASLNGKSITATDAIKLKVL